MTNIFTNPEMNDLRMSEKARPLFDAVVHHINDNVVPIAEEFEALGKGRADRWSWAPGQLELLQTAKDKAKAAGLWNFFLPNAETGEGLSPDYSPAVV
jgi:acyl-CoA dehydrogenase